jgi:hypothetical protein
MQHEFRRLGDGPQAVLKETKRAITPFGGLVVLIELLRQLDFLGTVRRHLLFQYTSTHAIPPEHTLPAFLLAVAGGARRFAHLGMLRCDEALRQLRSVPVFPSDDTVRNFFRRFGPGEVERFFPALWRWLLEAQPPRACTLDLDSSVFQRFGQHAGAVRGYNPTRRKGACHHPLFAFLGEPTLVLHSWLRSGNTADAGAAAAFLREALALLPAGWSISGLRADSGFLDQTLLGALEGRALYRRGPVQGPRARPSPHGAGVDRTRRHPSSGRVPLLPAHLDLRPALRRPAPPVARRTALPAPSPALRLPDLRHQAGPSRRSGSGATRTGGRHSNPDSPNCRRPLAPMASACRASTPPRRPCAACCCSSSPAAWADSNRASPCSTYLPAPKIELRRS